MEEVVFRSVARQIFSSNRQAVFSPPSITQLELISEVGSLKD